MKITSTTIFELRYEILEKIDGLEVLSGSSLDRTSKKEFHLFESESGHSLPNSMQEFYSSINGFMLSWHYINPENSADVITGEVNIMSLGGMITGGGSQRLLKTSVIKTGSGRKGTTLG